jgi:Ala-tRNA(Pro) deacylase
MRIAVFLQQQRVAFESLPHAPAYSAQQLAKYLRLPGAQVAKAVLLRGPSSFLLAVVPATRQVDTDKLSWDLGGPVRLASNQEAAGLFPDCEWGVVPPFGGLYGLETLLDESIPTDAWIVFEAHTTVVAIRLRCRDFVRLERPLRLRLACPS